MIELSFASDFVAYISCSEYLVTSCLFKMIFNANRRLE